MTAKELAELLNGREYMHELSVTEAAQAKAHGLVVLFGYSDDNMEFEGAFRDEVGCSNGGVAYLTKSGLLVSECADESCPYFERIKAEAATITANWDSEGYSWTYTTDIPHETFDILEGDEKYCRGIVFSLADVPH